MRKISFIFIFVLVLGLVLHANAASSLASRLEGKILLQVESHGEAWYVYQGERRYMPDGRAAYEIMRFLGLGITDADLASIPAVSDSEAMKESATVCSSNSLASRVKGRILLQVQQNGEAWYVDTDKCLRIYMKDGTAAYSIMRYLSLGISDQDLSTIPSSDASGYVPPSSDTPSAPLSTLTAKELVAKLSPMIVVVSSGLSQGSGFIIESDGYILTNAHVVEGESTFKIFTTDEKQYTAYVVGRDEIEDVALLKISEKRNDFPVVQIISSDDVEKGEDVFALGFPLGLGADLAAGIDVSVSKGILSAHPTIGGQHWLQSDVSIHPGNSGGPLVNDKGQVVGINTAGSTSGDLTLAIPTTRVNSLLPLLKQGRDVSNTQPVENKPTTPLKPQHPDAAAWPGYKSRVDYFVQQSAEAAQDFTNGSDISSYDEDGALSYFQSCSSTAQNMYESATIMPTLYSLKLTDKLRQNMVSVSQAVVKICDYAKILVLSSGNLYNETYGQLEVAVDDYQIYSTAFDETYGTIVALAESLGYSN